MNNARICQALRQLLTEKYALYLKTQNYHWNVVGPNFRSLHLMFEEQYKDLAEAIDEVAERIRALGEEAPGSFAYFQENSKMDLSNNSKAAGNMLEDLLKGHEIVVEALNGVMQAAEEFDKPTEDMAIARRQQHDTFMWQLKSTLQ